MMNKDSEVILAILKLERAMRRCPPERGDFPFPPAIGRLLGCAAENPGVSSRELCEILDVRPSSLSEMLARAESDKLLTRTVDEEDRRVQRITLSDLGRRLVSDMEAARDLDARKKTACLSDEEKEKFCAYCNKLSEHIEKLALDLPEDRLPPPPRGRGPVPGPEGEPPCFRYRPEDEAPKPPRPRKPLPPGGRMKS